MQLIQSLDLIIVADMYQNMAYQINMPILLSITFWIVWRNAILCLNSLSFVIGRMQFGMANLTHVNYSNCPHLNQVTS